MKTVEERFWKKVNKVGLGDCWEWIGAKTPLGYGKIGVDHKTKYAHRVSWELHNGRIKKGFCVMHQCDNPSCVNPIHLQLGTQLENMRDRDAKGRHKPRGYYDEEATDNLQNVKEYVIMGVPK